MGGGGFGGGTGGASRPVGGWHAGRNHAARFPAAPAPAPSGTGAGAAAAGAGAAAQGGGATDAARSRGPGHEPATTRWAAATVGAKTAADYQLATGDAVMAIGGFSGSDPSPTLAQFEAYVRAGEIHYFIGSGAGGFGGGSGGGGGGGFGGGTSASTASAIRSWVESNFTSQTVGGVTLYDLTS